MDVEGLVVPVLFDDLPLPRGEEPILRSDYRPVQGSEDRTIAVQPQGHRDVGVDGAKGLFSVVARRRQQLRRLSNRGPIQDPDATSSSVPSLEPCGVAGPNYVRAEAVEVQQAFDVTAVEGL